MRPATAFLLRILLLCAFFFSGGAATFSATADAESGRRVALVVGNGDYAKAGRLLNPTHDAVAVADELQALDFKVFLSRDVDQGGFAAALGEFLKALDGAEVGLFFFAGHGIQINGQNFLLSTNATGENEFLIPAEGMELASIIERMEQRAAISLVFVDACRNNPLAEQFARKNPSTARALGMTRGLARVDRLGRNTLVVYATAPNQTASDGNGTHSPFTAGLLRHMSTPGLEVSAMLKRVAGDVLEETGSEQQPEVVASMTSEFYFQLGEAASGTSERPAVVNDLDQRRVAAETAFEFAKKLGTLEAYRFFLQSYGDSTFADAAELAVAALEEEAKKSTNMDISIDSAFPGTTEHGGTACHWIVVPSILWKNSPVVIQEATIAELADELDRPLPTGQPRTDLMTFVGDRPRHDFRYAMDTSKIERELGWRPLRTFEAGLRETVEWYLANRASWLPLRGRYHGERLGALATGPSRVIA